MGAAGQGLQRPGWPQASESSHILRCRSAERNKAIPPDGDDRSMAGSAAPGWQPAEDQGAAMTPERFWRHLDAVLGGQLQCPS